MKRSWIVGLATLGPVGLLKGSGTVATLLTLPLVYSLTMISPVWASGIISGICFSALLIVNRAIVAFPGQHDPSAIVIDEVAGCLVTFVGIAWRWQLVLIGFITFRLLDIFKPLGIKQIEYCIAPLGIVLDDIFAGFLSNIFVRIICIYFFSTL
ncbi:MAG TPA: phosphatidylglycerophosphatase A [Candidatus Babeliales bacterium]|nr:phosphatidylglycerophosphatase A [Candidatus Babeliales bacterium]